METENKIIKEIVVKNIAKNYSKRPVLKNVSINVKQGEAVGLLGPNGAGKTTCFYCITGLITPDTGSITLSGENITKLPFYRRAQKGIGYLPQESSIFRSLTVEDNIMAVLEVVEPYEDKRNQKLDEHLAEFSITHLRESPAIALSGGERRRLEIARALAANPDFILLDEPFAGVDPIAVNVLITDHNVRETLEITDRAYVLHNGTVLCEGTPDAIVCNPNARKVYLGENFKM